MLYFQKGVRAKEKVSGPNKAAGQGLKYDSNRHLILPGPSKNFKFCRICGYKARASTAIMQKHFNGKHQGQPAKFLSWKEQPIHCMYLNWDQWFRERDAELVVKPEFGKSMYGRPKTKSKLSVADMLEEDGEDEEELPGGR
jgi:hypothetical protein